MGFIKSSAKVVGSAINFSLFVPVTVFYRSIKRNTGQGSGVIKGLYDSVKLTPCEQQLTVGLIDAVEKGELPEEQILRLPRQRFLFVVLACLIQIIYISWGVSVHGMSELLYPTFALAISVAFSLGVYYISAKTQCFINRLHTNYKRTAHCEQKALYKIALWYRFFLAKKRTYQFGCLLFAILSTFNFITTSILWAIIPLFAALLFFVPNMFNVQHRLWQLRERRLSEEERGGLGEFFRESNWLIDCLNPELFNKYTGELKHEA